MRHLLAYVLPPLALLQTRRNEMIAALSESHKQGGRMDIRRTWLLALGTGAMVVATALTPTQADAQVTGSGIRVSKDAYVPTVRETASGTVIDAPGFNAVDSEVYRTMTDAN